MRSRGSSLPRAVCFSRALAPPPSALRPVRLAGRRPPRATARCLAWKSGERGSICEVMTLMDAGCRKSNADDSGRHGAADAPPMSAGRARSAAKRDRARETWPRRRQVGKETAARSGRCPVTHEGLLPFVGILGFVSSVLRIVRMRPWRRPCSLVGASAALSAASWPGRQRPCVVRRGRSPSPKRPCAACWAWSAALPAVSAAILAWSAACSVAVVGAAAAACWAVQQPAEPGQPTSGRPARNPARRCCKPPATRRARRREGYA